MLLVIKGIFCNVGIKRKSVTVPGSFINTSEEKIELILRRSSISSYLFIIKDTGI